MCGRIACTLCPDEIVKNCNYANKENELENPKWLDSLYEYKPVYNGPPTTIVPVMAHHLNFSNADKEGSDYCVTAMKWGMAPTYKTETAGNFHTHNARKENLLKSTLYRPCLTSGKRCVVLADGYYEWQTTQGENHKQPYYLYQSPEGDDKKYLMKLAGLFNITRDDMGLRHTCTILTTESDSSLTWMHYRMPIILNTDTDIRSWLNYEDVNYTDALKNLPKCSQWGKKYQLKYHAVTKTFVNNTSCNEPKCLQRMTTKRKSSTLDSWLKPKK